MRDPQLNASRSILFLRPFWDPDLTAEQVRVLVRIVAGFGQLVVIRNGTETIQAGNRERGLRRWANLLLVRVRGDVRSEDPILIEATEDTWHEHAIAQIRLASAILLHLAPRSGPTTATFPPIRPTQNPQQEIGDFANNPIHETGTGQGLLRELDFCKQAEALSRTVVLVPSTFYPRIQEAIDVMRKYPGGELFARTDHGLVPLTARLSAADVALTSLSEVSRIVSYTSFGGFGFTYRVRRALDACTAVQLQHASATSDSHVAKGIPSEAVPLPPDGEPKRIRFTPIQRLTRLPRGQITEVSLEEVGQVHGALEGVNCPKCGKGSAAMFWYQYGLHAQISPDDGVFMRCQYCGHDDYL